ncbi:integral membrane protein [Theileria orientalis]|uniref:Integral membrane protein n=1 Tax=Theileria orientalis TaxID=68886 RepID=A0A976M5D9_THEOR|nr:integral membrane protein [Theileria orientalis]
MKLLGKVITDKTFKERHEIVSWLTLSYLLNISLLMLQIVGLMHYMYMCQQWCLYLVILDALCLFKWIVSSLPKMVGHKGSSCWVVYTRIFTIKSFVIFFWVLPEKPRSKGVLIRSVGGSSIEIMLLLFITPTIYAILAFNTGVHLYGGLNMISSERLIHSDMIIHVVFDFLDIIDIFHKFSIDYNSMINTFYFYKIFCGVFLATPIFLHGYSFPCMSGASMAKTNKNLKTNTANDIYFCRKFAAIVGIFFVDLPFLFIRIYSWQSRVHYSAFGPFMLKNLCFLLLQITRIRQTSTAIRSLETTGNSNKTTLSEATQDHTISDINDQTAETIVKKYVDETKSVNLTEILLKILFMVNVDIKSELTHYLDNNLSLSNWSNTLLSLPVFIFSATKFILTFILVKIVQKDCISYGIELLRFENLHSVFTSSSHRLFLTCFEVLIVSCILIFLIWSILGPMLEALLLSLSIFIRLSSFVYSLIVVCCYIDSFKLLEILASNSLGKPIYYIFIIFSFKPFVDLLINLYPLLCVFLGKKNIYYINPSTFKHNKLKLHENILFKKNIQDVSKYMANNDEICVVNLSLFVLLINCKEMCSAYSSYTLLVGPNLIKASRLHYGLFYYHKRRVITTLLIRVFCLLLTFTRGGSLELLTALFVIDMALMLFYTLYTCVQRIIAMEAMELQIIANDIINEQNKDELTKAMNFRNIIPVSEDNKIYRKFKRHYEMCLQNSLFSML